MYRQLWGARSKTERWELGKQILSRKRPGAMAAFVRDRMSDARRDLAMRDVLAGFKVFHIQFLFPNFSTLLPLLPPGARVLLSVCGSDLLRTAGVETYARQLALCERADLITVRSLEMREIFLAKFGRGFFPKMRLARWGDVNLPLIDTVDSPDQRRSFLARQGIPQQRCVVCVGHNGFPENQHLEVLSRLAAMDPALKQHLALIIPMTYGGDEEYRAQVREAALQTGMPFTILTDYLTSEDVARLRVSADVMIHVPISDSLGGSMCATLYAGNAVITGAWLPYGELRRLAVPMFEIESFDDLPQVLYRAADRQKMSDADKGLVRQRIRDIADWSRLTEDWCAVYRELLQGAGGANS